MRRIRTILCALALVLATNAVAQRYVGGDISLLKAYEDKNAPYYDDNGTNVTPLLPYLKNTCGMNAMRVRLFHTPSNASSTAKGEGVFQDLDYVKVLGKEIKDAGLAFMLDFHYSDTWADPAKQWTPKAWLGASDGVLQDSIYNYTKSSLQALKDYGATPDFIQIGNEISYGMLWGAEGTIVTSTRYYAIGGTDAQRTRFTSFLKQAAKACREVCPDAKIIIHTERVAQPDYLVQFYKDMDNAGVDYDIIGTSYYSYYHGFLPQLSTALKQIEQNFTKDIMVVETGYYNSNQGTVDYDYSATYPVNADGQKAFTQALIDTLANHPQVKGLFWWEMDANDGTGTAWNTQHVLDSWYNAGLVDNATSRILPAAYVLKDFLTGSSGIHGVNADASGRHDDRWYTLQGQRIGEPSARGVYIHDNKKVVKK